LPLTSDSVQFGRGVFESFASLKDGRVFLLERHLERLIAGLETTRIPRRPGRVQLRGWLADLLAEAPEGPQRLKIMAFAEGVWLSATPLEPDLTGAWLLLSHLGNRSLSGIKATAYLESLLAWENVREKGGNEALLCNHHGIIYEGSRTNFFWILNGKIWTKEEGVLPGTVRGFLLEDAPTGIHLGTLKLRELGGLEGAFVTNSVLGIKEVNQIDQIKIPKNSLVSELQSWFDQQRQKLAQKP